MNNPTTVVMDRRIDDVYQPSRGTKQAVGAGTRFPDYIVDVSRPIQPWNWTTVLLAPLQLLAVVWSVPFVILMVGIPFVFAVSLIYRVGRLLLSYF
jgi:hypothetical protein